MCISTYKKIDKVFTHFGDVTQKMKISFLFTCDVQLDNGVHPPPPRITNEPMILGNIWLKFKTFRKITNHFRRIYLKFIKKIEKLQHVIGWTQGVFIPWIMKLFKGLIKFVIGC